MAGIYVHIPFCKKACNYCNFHFSTSTTLQDKFLYALLREIELQKHYVSKTISTIYFGGGTPSILPIHYLAKILEHLRYNFSVNENAEVTIEANPDDIDTSTLLSWQQIGFNRLSMGVQSFFEEDLLWMNRAHTANQAVESITKAKQAGFDNITIDLIYGTPTLTDEYWYTNVHKAIDAGVMHLSCYALTIEPKTALEKLITQKKVQAVDADKQAHQFELLMKWMEAAGYEHYEISNFAKPGYRSRHNSSYWSGKEYLGLGPSAHSFNGESRQWNVANNSLYIKAIEMGEVPATKEALSMTQQLNEYIMTSLRTIEGLSLQKIKDTFGTKNHNTLLQGLAPHITQQHLVIDGDFVRTTTKGKLYADGIAADLFII